MENNSWCLTEKDRLEMILATPLTITVFQIAALTQLRSMI
jgi:hypothetical protein